MILISVKTVTLITARKYCLDLYGIMPYTYISVRNIPMNTKLYLITYEGSQWCGASDTHVVVSAETPQDAEDKASFHMEEEMRDLFSAEYEELIEEEGEGADEECAYVVTSVEEFGPEHESWKYYKHETQSQFFPEIVDD